MVKGISHVIKDYGGGSDAERRINCPFLNSISIEDQK